MTLGEVAVSAHIRALLVVLDSMAPKFHVDEVDNKEEMRKIKEKEKKEPRKVQIDRKKKNQETIFEIFAVLFILFFLECKDVTKKYH